MKRLPTVAAAIKEIEALQNFVDLAYRHPDTRLFDKALKYYAFTGSLKETTKIINEERKKHDMPLIDEYIVRDAILSKPENPLHRILRTNYMIKTRPLRLR